MHVEFDLPAELLWIPAVWAIFGVLSWPLFAYWCSIWISGPDTWMDWLLARRIAWWRRVLQIPAWLLAWPLGLYDILASSRYRKLWRRS